MLDEKRALDGIQNGAVRGRIDVGLELHWGARTDTGRRRKRNEDALLTDAPVFAVADGMGGHARGDLAAAMAMDALRQILLSADGGRTVGRATVLDQIRQVDEAIHRLGCEQTEAGMGTTVCGIVATLDEPRPSVLVFNVGDSRVYIYRTGSLMQVSIDHSVVQELLEAGEIEPAEVATHPERNVVTRSLGSGEPLDIDWWSFDVSSGDRWLLCSDGLVKEVAEDRIAEILRAEPTARSAADQLVEAALDGGGRDNVTVVVVDVSGELDVDPSGLDAETNPREASVSTRPRPIPGHVVGPGQNQQEASTA